MAVCPPWKDSFSENENVKFPASRYDIGAQRIPSTIMILRTPERILFNVLEGCLSSFTPQYIVRGSEIIPTQVIMVPKGKESLLSNATVSKEDPVNKSTRVVKVKIRAM